MRLFFAVLILLTVVPLAVWAQSDGETSRRYYNTQTDAGAKLYNSPTTYSRGPLSLKQMLEGRDNAATGSQNSYYGGSNYRPYGIDNSSNSLALSPEEVQASRARRDALAQQMEHENMRLLEQQANANILEEQTGEYLSTFQPVPEQQGTTQPKIRPIYRKREKGFEMPEKVFNSVR